MQETNTIEIVQVLVPVLVSLIASSGFWLYIDKKMNLRTAQTRLMIGLAHDRIVWLGMHYIERGWITQDEYENLKDYLYKPYEELGGNGSARRVMNDVDRLPIKKGKSLNPVTGETIP